MADIEITADIIPEIPRGLDKLRDAFMKATFDGIQGGAALAYSQGIAKHVDTLKKTNLSSENSEQVLYTALASRVYANQAASAARASGDPAAISLAAINQETIQKIIRDARGYPALQERQERAAARNAERQEKAEARAAEKQERDAERIAQKEAREAQREFERASRIAEKARISELKQAQNISDFNYFDDEYAKAQTRLLNAETPEDIKDALGQLRLVGSYRMRTAGRIYDIKDQAALKASTDQDVIEGQEKLADALKENTSSVTEWVKTYRTAIASGAMGISAGNYLSRMVQSYYANRDNPYTELGGKIDDLIQWAGAGAGALLGFGIGGPVGAAVGGGIGAWLGGTFNRTRSAAISTQEDTLEQLRWALRFGGEGAGYWYSRFVDKTGLATQEDMQTLKLASTTFGPSVALGQVSADQWMALYHLPNTMAALNSGADEATLLEAMQTDAGMYSPGWATKWFQMAGLPDNLRVLATSGMLQNVNRDIPVVQRMSEEFGQVIPATVPAYYDRGVEDVTERRKALMRTIQSAGVEYYHSVGPTFGSLDYGAQRSIEDLSLLPRLHEDILAGREPSTLTPATININIDGENVLKLNGVYADTEALEDKVEYTAGGL